MINSKLTRSNSTLGLIETTGFIGAVEALDVAAKSASVELVSCEFVKGGIVTILITGEVGSVKAAVEAAAIAVDKLGVLRNTHVIARADEGVWSILEKKETIEIFEDKNITEEKQSTLVEEKQEIKEAKEDDSARVDVTTLEQSSLVEDKSTIESTKEEEISLEDGKENLSENLEKDKNQVITKRQLSKSMKREELEALKVTELRSLARQLREELNISLTKKQIKFSKKEQLIEAILKGN
ncbi:microcompartment protein CcmL/EutN [Clostridium punense]|uniref:Microcompartment protein CcmL/EutN n=1 Tax=Clostridium punense TaxID=1054297 RepID=A0ABS4K4W3_9CLOT|nr:BMC domain-containing protein [Clostridium punense]MBP2022171.1 microcompartment protein CcmL/EutN [Clostridium punense]